MRKRHIARVTPIACALLCASYVGAQQERSPFDFAGGSEPIVLRAGAESGAQILNNTTRPLSLAVSLIDVPAAGDRQLSAFVELDPKLSVPAAGEGTIVLRPRPDRTLEPGAALDAYLVVSDGASDTVRRRAVKLVAAERGGLAGQPEPKSLVASLKAAVHYWPWSDGGEVKVLNVPLPLDAKLPAAGGSYKLGETVAKLAASDGETALVRYERADAELPGGTSGLVLGFKSGGSPGEYAGEMLGVKGRDGKPVTLTVVSAHTWPLPALACFVGILGYYLMIRYLKVGRRVRELLEQEAGLRLSFVLAAQHFAEASAGRPYAADSIADDFSRRCVELRSKIRRLRLTNLLSMDEGSDAYKDVVKQLAELGAVARNWSSFAEGKLNPLDDRLRDARAGFSSRPPEVQQEVPAVAAAAVAVLAPTGPATIEDFGARAASADTLLPPLSSWRRLNTQAAAVWRRYQRIVEAADFAAREPESQEEIKEQRKDAYAAWRGLWIEESFDPVEVGQKLSDLNGQLAFLGIESGAVAHDAAAPPPHVEAAPDEQASQLSARVAGLARGRAGWDVFYLLLATAVAVHTGLGTYYYDKPFGTLRDYANLLVWGFGTKALLDMVTGALNRFWPAPGS